MNDLVAEPAEATRNEQLTMNNDGESRKIYYQLH